MKHKLSLFLVVLFTYFISSAFTVKNIETNNNINVNNIIQLAMGGDWVIGTYTNGKGDFTQSLSQYSLTFNGDGSISVFAGSAVGVPGQYSESASTMSLFFDQPDLSQLNGDWQIVSKDDSMIRLARDNSQLVFVRNGNAGTPTDIQ